MKGCPTSYFPIHVPHRHDRDTFESMHRGDLSGIHAFDDRNWSLNHSYNDALPQQRKMPLEGFMDFPALLSSLMDIRVPGPVESEKGLEEVVMNLERLLGGTCFHNIY